MSVLKQMVCSYKSFPDLCQSISDFEEKKLRFLGRFPDSSSSIEDFIKR